MLVEHRSRRPNVHPSAWVAPTAVLVAVGDQVLPPDRHDEIWAVQQELDFPGTVYGEPRGEDLMARVMPRQAAWLGAHRDDRVL
jgi:gamma-carbonic anhydrase